MGTRGKKKSCRSIYISFVREEGVRDAVYLPSDTERSIVAVMRRLVRAWAAHHYRGARLETRDINDTENLPPFCLNKLREKNLIEHKVVVLTLFELVEADRQRRSNNKKFKASRAWRIGVYLLEKSPQKS